MALQTDDQDIRDVRFYMETGGNGDYYLNLIEFDKNGVFIKSLNMRVAMSGGNAPHEVKMKVSDLFKAMEAAKLNEHPLNEITPINMSDVFPKFIVEGNCLIIAKCTYHKELVTDKEKVKGGGLWKWDREKKEITLYGSSFDFGRASTEDIKTCIEAGNVFLSYEGGRNVSDQSFILKTGIEIIKLK